MEQETNNTQASYDRVSRQYVERLLHEFDHKPLDRELLDRFAKQVTSKGRACDLGCGPGQVARYLHGRGADVFGIDLSPMMVERAREANPDIEFRQGNMQKLDLPDESLAGIAAFYSIIHIPRGEVTQVLKELRRVLQPGGVLLLAFHRGEEVRHLDEWWEQPVSLDFTFFEPEEMSNYLRAADLQVDEVIERAPYPEIETQTQRVYIFASKAAN
jgi:ubiquinone/menaquinone biosynthesis C-methylase UbiE